MERDCQVVHGAADYLKRIMNDRSDGTVAWICEKCEMIGWYDPSENFAQCSLCDGRGYMTRVEMPHANILLLHELMAMGQFPRLKVEVQ